MTGNQAYCGCDIFDGHHCHQRSALLARDGEVTEIVDDSSIPAGYQLTQLRGGLLAPGFVDLQVNGGGGVLLNDKPDLSGIETICATHTRMGTTSLLPTLITDTPEVTTLAIDAAITAHQKAVPGFLGLHLEGPHLSVSRKGAHDESFIRKMTETDLKQLLHANKHLPNLLITIAPESVRDDQINTLSSAGITVSLGHTDASCKRAIDAINAGARCITHLFNAMSPLGHREPGVTGAALASGQVYAGLIADGYHVDKTAMSLAIAAKKRPGEIFLVTDAMSVAGTDDKSFTLNGRTIVRKHGRLTLADGTLAGADLTMPSAIQNIVKLTDADKFEALRMASLYPAECLSISSTHGHLQSGAHTNMVQLDDTLNIQQVWQRGHLTFGRTER